MDSIPGSTSSTGGERIQSPLKEILAFSLASGVLLAFLITLLILRLLSKYQQQRQYGRKHRKPLAVPRVGLHAEQLLLPHECSPRQCLAIARNCPAPEAAILKEVRPPCYCQALAMPLPPAATSAPELIPLEEADSRVPGDDQLPSYQSAVQMPSLPAMSFPQSEA